MKKLTLMSNLQTHCHFKLYFEVNQHTGAMWLHHGAKHPKDKKNQMESPELPVEYPSRKSEYDIKESITCSMQYS